MLLSTFLKELTKNLEKSVLPNLGITLLLGDRGGAGLFLIQAPPDRKSIGAEVNYGVRFDTQSQADEFLSKLAVELSSRMAGEGVVGRALTLKIMKQRDVRFGMVWYGMILSICYTVKNNTDSSTDAKHSTG